MVEQSPEPQKLPVFAGSTVRYWLNLSQLEEGEKLDLSHSVDVPVDDIDLIPDPRLRSELWSQFVAAQSRADYSIVVYALPDGSHSHSYRVRVKPSFSDIALSSESINQSPEDSRTHESPTNFGMLRRLARRVIG